FSTPASGYQTVTASQLDTSTYFGSDYHAFADVTTRVRSGGSGTYTVANVQSGTGEDRQAGWALVVVYRNAALPSRNLTVFDGYATVNTTNPLVTINVSGFVTPTSGTVNTHVGVVAYEGDRGSTGDQIQLNSTTLTDALNPSTNFFNSTITRFGSHLTAKNPNYVNQLGFDIDDVTANGVLPNGATSATITLRTAASGVAEFYYPGVVTFVTDLYAPAVKGNITKSVADLNGGIVAPGDILEYTVTVSNTGTDTAILSQMYDPLPAGTTFSPGSLEVTTGANAGAKSDAAGDDQAEYDAGQNRVVFRLGTGADASNGGSLATNQSTTARFRVVVNSDLTNGATVSNQATVNYRGATLGINYTDLSDSDPVAPGEQPVSVSVAVPPRVELVKSVSPTGNVLPGTELTYTVTFRNLPGSATASALVISDKIPDNTDFKLGSAAYSAGDTGLPAPLVEYSTQPRDTNGDDPPNPWLSYTPTGAPGTLDPAVTYVRFRFVTGTLPANTSGSVSFTVKVR
ncbi:MAG TPA: isopeptide-forming domain-containing fimbrial protein, partial [Pyrinomonadaceae bacterium]|nr:isopeptide-forming domain-containing fimbrial protein [Pyrinomonadaceae bacterium]